MNPQRLDIDYDIVWHGRWHTGSGYSSVAVDRLQHRDWGGAPVIPGSLIKGVLRHHCERLVRAFGLPTVDPHSGAEPGDRELIRHFRPLHQSEVLVDRLFGTRYQGECLFMTNAVPSTRVRKHETQVAARTSIDRVTGTVMDAHLFTTEVVEGEAYLSGKIRARHPARVLTQDEDGFPFEYSLLVAALLSIDAIGGDKSAGLGRCVVRIEGGSLGWNGETISVEKALESLQETEWADLVCIVREEQGQ